LRKLSNILLQWDKKYCSNRMPGCPYFIANTFLHLFGGLLLTGISTEHQVISDLDKKPLTQFGIFLGTIFLLFLMMAIENMFLKYILFVLFCFLFGQSLAAYVKKLKQQHLLSDTLFIVGVIFVCMTGVGIYDKGNMLGWANYLYAGLIGLLVATILNMFLPSKARKESNVWLSRFVVLLFTLYIGYDVQILKAHAKACKSNPDYISESLNLYLDIVNLFSGVGNSMND